LDSNKVLYSWGRNRFGQLGQGVADEDLKPDEESGINNLLPQLVKGPLHNVKID
jgi:hypothetical protein